MAATNTQPDVPTVTSPTTSENQPPTSTASSSSIPAPLKTPTCGSGSSSDIAESHSSTSSNSSTLSRPPIGPRQSSGTIIIPRDSPAIEVREETYAEGDARAMSPRRSSDEIERMGDEARENLEEQARSLQANLLEIVDRVETVKSEHEKLEGRNKFLQS